MIISIRLAPTAERLDATLDLGTLDVDAMPVVGTTFSDGRASYRVVRMEPGAGDQGGPIAYVVKSSSRSSPGMAADAPAEPTPSAVLRDCIDRADIARLQGDSERYRRHVEEFLFRSKAIPGHSAPDPSAPRQTVIPYFPVYGGDGALARRLRDALLHHRYAALVEPVPTLEAVRRTLDRKRGTRPVLFLVAAQPQFRTCLAALHAIRRHALSPAWPVLVLAQPPREGDRALTLAAGATAYEQLPTGIDDYAPLIARLHALASGSDPAPDAATA